MAQQLSRPPISLCILLGFVVLALPSTAWADKPDDPGFVQFGGSSFPVKEDAGNVTIRVKRQRGSTGAVSVDYATTDGSAIDGEDYLATAGTLSWDDGDRQAKTFTVEILDDADNEGQETFGVVLSNPVGTTLGAVNTSVVRIKPSDRGDDDDSDSDSDEDSDGDSDGDTDGDSEDAGVIKLTAVAFPAFESNGEATFVVERVDGDNGPVGVDFTTIDGSAEADVDYLLTLGTLTWDDGQDGPQTVTVPLIDDDENEALETISIVLTQATGGARLGERDLGSIVIIDDDSQNGACVPDGETLCLRDGRFQIVGTWTDFDGNEGPFQVIPSSDETGLVYFFDDSNIEILVKVLGGCPVNGHYWVFFAATTNLGFTMEVTDLESGLTEVYENPVGTIPLAVTDVTAFANCP